jgi:alpha-tubulin suppressor-like RCC1 family protein
LDIDPEYAPAYVGKLCAELEVQQEEQLAQNGESLTGYNHYQKAARFANVDYRTKLEQYNKIIQERIAEEERQKREREHRERERFAEARRREAERIAEEKRQAAERLLKARERITEYQGLISTGGDSSLFVVDVNGTVVAVGYDKSRDNKYGPYCVTNWRDIVAVTTHIEKGIYGRSIPGHTVGLKKDGTVVAVGNNDDGQCNVGNWCNIVAVANAFNHTVGLKRDGTVVAVGNNDNGQCNVGNWRNIVAVAASGGHTVGLKKDGTVVAVGWNDDYNVNGWRDIVAIDSGQGFTVGVKTDGTVVAVGNNEGGQCDVSDWRDVIAVVADRGVHFNKACYTIGLKSDGTVVVTNNYYNKKSHVFGWRDIVAVADHYSNTVGLKMDGTVVVKGEKINGEFSVSQLRQRQGEEQGLCRYCGGQIGGLFSKKCKSCGKTQA